MELKDLVRENIWNLNGYSSARHEFEGKADVFLDANENPFESDINRYPDPFQADVKDKLSDIKNITTNRIFLGNGSDEAIDLIMRIFCKPGVDQILTFPPTYGMYKVSADINDVEVIESSLTSDYQIDVNDALSKVTDYTKVAFICSPNNPTGNLIDRSTIEKFMDSFGGITVIDEAYIDFADTESMIHMLDRYPRLIVMQTLSKAWGAAGIRLGLAYANQEIIALFNKVKPPYNINSLTQQKALTLLNNVGLCVDQKLMILSERKRVQIALQDFDFVRQIHPSDANFILVEFDHAERIFEYLRDEGVVIRNRTKTHLCADCLRITIGTPEENKTLLEALKEFKA